ncbi:MAG TPA: sn-glycerol-3-phosphate ABC transporter ATP-binding protein UgpC [Acidimicrobiales bacterium]
MAAVTLDDVSKRYPNGVEAVSHLDLAVADGELVVLVGPSGCGKTTALRMVAGLEEATGGTIRVGDRVVNDLSPRERDIAMVFQNYALYPHMTVAENIGFALKLRRLPKGEVRAKVEDAARILGLTEQLDRKPAQLSGGQRQRVAMGRAIVREPAVFLMDEPLSNLDAKLRVQMRAEVLRIQRRLGVSTLYVTHDQTEAMTMGNRVAVLQAGQLQQYDRPQVLYDAPANLFVAAFIGSPAMNLYEARVADDGRRVHLGDQALELPAPVVASGALGPFIGKPVVVGLRPEDLVDPGSPGGAPPGRRLIGEVEFIEALGSELLVHLRTGMSKVQALETTTVSEGAEAAGLQEGEFGLAARMETVVRVPPSSLVKVGERAAFGVDTDRLHFFDSATGRAIGG